MSSVLSIVRARRLLESGDGRDLRLRAGLSLDQVAAEVGVSGPAVYAWESGSYAPRGEHAVRYARLIERLARELDP